MIEDQYQPESTTETPPEKPRPSWLRWTLAGCGLLLCLAAVAVLGLSLLFPSIGKVAEKLLPNSKVNITGPNTKSGLITNDNTMGDPNAPVKIIEYGDFQCPYCLRFWQQTEPKIIETYVTTGKVFFEYRSVGGFIGPESAAAAEAAYCAADQGKFWEYHDTLFSHWTGENVGDFANERLLQYAAAIGLDETVFDNCLTLGANKARVERDVANAKADGIRATPSFLINGRLVEGALSFDEMKSEIEAALNHRPPDSQQGFLIQKPLFDFLLKL